MDIKRNSSLLKQSVSVSTNGTATAPAPHPNPNRHFIEHDNVAHHPLGAGSYIFRTALIQHINAQCTKQSIIFHVGAQPNSSPHMGTIINFAVAFFLAAKLRDEHGRAVLISLDLVDTAPAEQTVIDGIRYQRSQRLTRAMDAYMPDFVAVLDALHVRTGVKYRTRTQAGFLSDPAMSKFLSEVIHDRDTLAPSFAPETNVLGLRAACPEAGCGLADKHGIRNKYEDTVITFFCPHHGPHSIDVMDAQAVQRLELNTPLRNILRAKMFTHDPDNSWIHVAGADYAGYYQEQLLWKFISQPPLIFYTPLIVDWSGAKLSKSLYVQSGAYQYLKDAGMDYLISYQIFKDQGKDLRVILDEVAEWVEHPYMLFRSYSIAYLDSLFKGEPPIQGQLGK